MRTTDWNRARTPSPDVVIDAILAGRNVLTEAGFWATVAACVIDYRARVPDLAERFTRHDLFAADEIFLTGTGAEIVPVNKYDGHDVSGGKPGPCTRKLMEAYRAWLGQLPRQVADRIAHGNGERLFPKR